MPQFIIMYDYGYGENHELVEAEDKDAAIALAYESWRESAESNANYSATLATPELIEEHSL